MDREHGERPQRVGAGRQNEAGAAQAASQGLTTQVAAESGLQALNTLEAAKGATASKASKTSKTTRELGLEDSPFAPVTVAQLKFSKRREGADAELRVDVRAKNAADKTLFVRRDLDSDTLQALLGPDNAQRVVSSRQRGGTLAGEHLTPLPEYRPVPRHPAPSPPVKETDRTSLDATVPEPAVVRTARADTGRDSGSDPLPGSSSGLARHSARDVLGSGSSEPPAPVGPGGGTWASARTGAKSEPGERADRGDQVELDRRAAQALREHQLKIELAQQYVQRDNEYRFRAEPARVAFVDQGSKLSTQLATPSIARSMLDLAETKGWTTLRVRGDEAFRRQVWLEAGLRDMKVVGYDATVQDRELLQRERTARQLNVIETAFDRQAQRTPGWSASQARPAEPMPAQAPPPLHTPAHPQTRTPTSVPPPTSSTRADRSGFEENKRQVLAVLQAALKVEKVDQRTATGVLRSAEERLDQMVATGRVLPQARVYDRQAPREAPVRTHAPREVRERPARGR